jgi:6-phosphogluconolactonase
MLLTRLALVAVALLAVASVASAAEYWVYLGTYTGKDGSKGIYRCKFDDKTGKLTEAELAAEMGSPSFVAIHPSGKFLYAVGEGGGSGGGPVAAFSLDAKTGALTKLNQGLSAGAGPCHLSVHPKGTHVIVANYGGGSTIVFRLDSGKIGERTAFVQHEGTGPNKGRQEKPHAHCSFFDPSGKRAMTVDLGIDKVKVFAFDADKGELIDEKEKDVPTPPGSGPRHIALAPKGEYAYVCGELDSTVNVIQFSDKGGGVIQSLSTLPEPVKGNSTAECILSPNGRFVYVSNRGHNSVAVFKVGMDHKLTAAGHITGDIKIPRNFNIDPSGKWMLIASQDGGKVGVWELDPATGGGKETGTTVKVSRCVCVKFVPVEK